VRSALLLQGFTSQCVPNARQYAMREMGIDGELLVSAGSPPRVCINTGGYRPQVLQSLGVGFGARVSAERWPVSPSRATRGVSVAWWCIAVLCVPLCVRRYGVELQ
jgi:hypothetical protein